MLGNRHFNKKRPSDYWAACRIWRGSFISITKIISFCFIKVDRLYTKYGLSYSYSTVELFEPKPSLSSSSSSPISRHSENTPNGRGKSHHSTTTTIASTEKSNGANTSPYAAVRNKLELTNGSKSPKSVDPSAISPQVRTLNLLIFSSNKIQQMCWPTIIKLKI